MIRRSDLFAPQAASVSVALPTALPIPARADAHEGAAFVWSVAALCRAVSESLSARFALVSVRGEISGWSASPSGHCYFTLKDDAAQLRCAMFRRAAQSLGFTPREGDQVEIRARVAVYEQRGDLQLIVEHMQRSGQGVLFEEFLKLKARLQAQGLFDAQRKRTLPAMPRCIGLVTSLGAAALRDVATAWARRAPHVPVLLAPAQVQGAGAAAELIAALRTLYAMAQIPPEPRTPHWGVLGQVEGATHLAHPIDLIVLVRGGGSMQDLWCFNDEALAHTIAQSPVPLIAGIGHETDFTIADFCADVRAPTPTAAAELAAPERRACLAELNTLRQRLQRAAQRHIEHSSQRADFAARRLSAPAQQLHSRRLHIAQLSQALGVAASGSLRNQLQTQQLRHSRMHSAMQLWMQQQHHACTQWHTRVQLLSPEHLMRRGWAMVTHTDGVTLVTHTQQARVGTPLKVHLANGVLDVSVTQPKLI